MIPAINYPTSTTGVLLSIKLCFAGQIFVVAVFAYDGS